MTTFELRCNRFTWTNIVNATADDIQQLSKANPYIHPLQLEDLISPLERPKIEEEEQYLFIVMHFPVWDAKARLSRSSEVEFIVGRTMLVMAHDGTLKPLVQLFTRCETHPEDRLALVGKGANDAFYTILDQLVDYIFPILNKVDTNIHAIEESIFRTDARSIVRDIALVRRDIIALRRTIRHLVPIVQTLANTEHPIIRDDQEQYFEDIVDHLITARDIIDEDAEVMAGLADTADTLVSHRINEVMRVLTVISVIMLPLTLISGIYGMNIDLPLNEHPDAFIVVIGFMILIATGMLVYFRHRRWL